MFYSSVNFVVYSRSRFLLLMRSQFVLNRLLVLLIKIEILTRYIYDCVLLSCNVSVNVKEVNAWNRRDILLRTKWSWIKILIPYLYQILKNISEFTNESYYLLNETQTLFPVSIKYSVLFFRILTLFKIGLFGPQQWNLVQLYLT